MFVVGLFVGFFFGLALCCWIFILSICVLSFEVA